MCVMKRRQGFALYTPVICATSRSSANVRRYGILVGLQPN